MSEAREGGCQCGAVRYRVAGEPLALAACHCTECQRQSGSAFGMSLVVKREDFEILSGELRSFTRSSDSGRPLHCHFCPGCGCRIYHDPAYMDGVVNVRAGTLDETAGLEPTVHVWTKSKQRWVLIPPDAKTKEANPV